METSQLVQQYERLPAAAQRLVAELIALLNQHTAPAPEPSAAEPAPEGAIMLPPLDLTGVPTTWPENRFADPDFHGGWADREDITDSTEYVRKLRREQWGVKG